MVELASYDFMRSLLRLRIRGCLNRSISVTVFEMKATRLRGDPFDALGDSNRRAMVEPLRMSFLVECPVDHAFDVWTAQTSRWWPVSHTVSAEPGLEVVFQAGKGGRIYERTRNGVEVDWGEITVWEPPRRLGYLWHIRADRADATEVEITFTEEAT